MAYTIETIEGLGRILMRNEQPCYCPFQQPVPMMVQPSASGIRQIGDAAKPRMEHHRTACGDWCPLFDAVGGDIELRCGAGRKFII